ncbi:MAG: glycerophosphoryl diester phosphodiesterase [Pseudonocardiales bacterium]|nr:glycerophosphoryl diester phosphodiesterase [Pseudonocardiales bacterium]
MPFLDAPTPLAFAHRGFAPDGRENSMAAFERAVELGYGYLETDVRTTADGVALAFHDGVLDRVTDHRGRVRELTWAQVRHARIGGAEPIPLLVDLLGTWPDVRINVDVKMAAGLTPTIDAIRRTGAVDRVCVGAFSDSRVAAVRRALGPGLCTALGPREALGLRVASMIGRGARATAGRCAQVPARIGRLTLVDERYVRTAHELGVQVHVWTVNERSEMARLLDLGVDGIMTDAADVLRALLLERGQWHSAAA